MGVAAKTIERFAERLTRLYEQGADAIRIGDYVRHWRRWVTGSLGVRLQAWERSPIAGARGDPAGPTPGYRRGGQVGR